MKKTLICVLGVHCAIAIFAARSIHAQTVGTGAIQGTVEDTSGAVVQGATVTATDPKTGRTAVQSTFSGGNYRIDALPPSVYTVTVSAPGFTSIQQNNVEVDAMAVMTLNLQLKVGTAQTTVTVSAIPPQMDTSNGTLEVTLPNDVYTNLPLEMNDTPKNPLGFLTLVPGTQPAGFGYTMNGGPGQSSDLYINGMPVSSSTVQGDTRDIQTQTSTEIVDQFQVLTSGIPAYYSGNGIANLIMKSGTNKFHGDVYENIRNTVFDAAGYFAAKTPVEHQNEYGATLGGAIIKNKLFFLFNYDGYRFSEGSNPTYYAIPTAAERTGDFSALLAQGEVIYDPATTSCNSSGVCTRQAFPNNVIPSDRISHASNYLQSLLPATLNNSVQNNYLGSLTGGTGQNMYSGNFDYQLTSTNHIRFLTQHGSNPPIGMPPNGGPQLPLPYTSDRLAFSSVTVEQLTDAATFTPNLVNTFGLQFNRFYSPFVNPTTSGKYADNAGLRNLPAGDPQVEFPPVSFNGLNSPTLWDSYTYTYGWNEITNTYTVLDNVQWNRGPHSFTFGGQIQRFQDNVLFPSANFGYNFSNNETAGLDSDGTINESTGNSYASYLLGDVDNASLSDSEVGTTGMRYTAYALYAQDDWKVTQRLVINAGLRYDIPKPGVEVNNYQSWLNATLPNPAVGSYPGILQFAGNGTDSCHCGTPVSTDYLQFSPRVGFAYGLGSKSKYVIRGSYGINRYKAGLLSGGAYFQGSGYTGYEANPTFSSPNNGIAAAFQWDSPFPSYTPPPFLDPSLNTGYNTTTGPFGGGVTYPRPHTGGRMPYTQDWNLTFEDQMTPSLVTSVSYAASRSTHIPTPGGVGIYSDQINPEYMALGSLLYAPETPTTLAEAKAVFPGIKLPYPNFAGSIGQMLLPFPQYSYVSDPFAKESSSDYNSLQATAQKRMSHGLYFLLSYTWSKELSDSDLNIIPWESANIRSAYNLKQEEALDSNNPPQVLAVSYVYLLPVGRGRLLGGNMSHTLDTIFGDWQVSGIDSYSSGTPIGPIGGACNTPYTGGCYASYNANFSGSARINGSWGSGNPKAGTPYINAAAFMNATAFTFGNTPRTAPLGLHYPWFLNENLSLSKVLNMRKGINLKLQADAFNLFNRTIFGYIGTNIDSANFGQVGGQINQPRQLQFEAYFRF